ncbi:MAG: UDP-N-acetylglucosamine 2-epimerase (hydrolyzing) [Planctomycetes bacterium]|nr:UDP-N-acetylglucosamine 2-epimerase (hydrolyzing) [Planctomycetota bacterium]
MSTPLRRIGLLTTGRHDWGYLLPVARAVEAHPMLRPIVFVTGSHLHPAYGATASAVRGAGLETVDVPLFADTGSDAPPPITPADLAVLARELAPALDSHPVDVMIVLGDRIETLMAAVVTVASQVFLAHIHGGDRAPGEFDDANRHAITKLAHVHFPATRTAAERIARMGEEEGRICMVGSPGIDSILNEPPVTDAELAEVVEPIGEPYVVILQHPCGLGPAREAAAAEAVCQGVVDAGLRALCVEPNGDPSRDAIGSTLHKFRCRHGWPIFPNVARRVFLRLVRDAVALVGNSSAGMIESAAVGAIAVNVGDRQRGREHAGNVVHCRTDRKTIAETLRRLRDAPAWARELRNAPCIFGDGRASARIAAVLATLDLSAARRIKLNAY